MTWYQQLVSAFFGAAAGSAIITWLTQSLIRNRERELEIYRRRVDKVSELEDLVGYLTDRLVGHGDLGDAVEKLSVLDGKVGTFQRHDALRRAIREFHHAAALHATDRGQYQTADEDEAARARILECHKEVLKEADGIL